MTENQELETAYRLWKGVCELKNLLFDHYGEDFTDLYVDELIEKANPLEDHVDWPF